MSRMIEAKRTISLLVVLMAAIVALSGPVAEVLDLPAPVAEAKKKHKKKKKRHRPPAFKVVQCPGSGQECFGTEGRDWLVGTDSGETIFGQGGNDIFQGNGGKDNLLDTSLTSSDTYTGYEPSFAGFFSDSIKDDGGSADFLDLSSLRALDDIAFVRQDDPDPNPDNLFLDGPGFNDIQIIDHFGVGRIEKIKFANVTITGTQAQSVAREATPEEQAALEKSFEEERPPEDESPPQGKE